MAIETAVRTSIDPFIIQPAIFSTAIAEVWSAAMTGSAA